MPSGLHGVRCMGMPPTRLKAFRTTVERCLPGKHAGRSLTWQLVGVIQSGWWTQEVAHKAGISDSPFCLNRGPCVLGSAQHRLSACLA